MCDEARTILSHLEVNILNRDGTVYGADVPNVSEAPGILSHSCLQSHLDECGVLPRSHIGERGEKVGSQGGSL